ncbi:MAG: hypothetical protein HY607_00540 [Planctomycetes bacterium]|nr:hypothetical protein [Planctomycetota bacterium]
MDSYWEKLRSELSNQPSFLRGCFFIDVLDYVINTDQVYHVRFKQLEWVTCVLALNIIFN